MFRFFRDQKLWAWGGLLIILSSLWGVTQITVQISHWRRSFFDLIGDMLAKDGSTLTELEKSDNISAVFSGMIDFGFWAGIFVVVIVLTTYLTQRWLLNWRESVMWYYHDDWANIRTREGSSQRLQEDAKLFTSLLESVGEGGVSAIMILVAFSPILWGISMDVPELLFFNVTGGLMYAAIVWALGGTVVLVWLGRKLPGLQYKNQVAEAALRKELVLGEESADRADRSTMNPLWDKVQRNYRRLYFQYLTFGLGKWTFIQASVIVPLILVAPSMATAAITWGLLMQLLDAFGRVESSMQYLLRSWTIIVELISVHKRLRELEVYMKNYKTV
jgi:peptide/bleomycin uptake transporter